MLVTITKHFFYIASLRAYFLYINMHLWLKHICNSRCNCRRESTMLVTITKHFFYIASLRAYFLYITCIFDWNKFATVTATVAAKVRACQHILQLDSCDSSQLSRRVSTSCNCRRNCRRNCRAVSAHPATVAADGSREPVTVTACQHILNSNVAAPVAATVIGACQHILQLLRRVSTSCNCRRGR